MYKIIFFILLISFSLTSCFLNSPNFDYVNTKQFTIMEQKAKLKKEDAWKIYKAYCKKNNIHQDTACKGFLIGMFNHKYVFVNRFLGGKYFSLSGSIYINTRNQKIKYIRKTRRVIYPPRNAYWRGDADSTSNKHKGNSIIEQLIIPKTDEYFESPK